MQNLAVALTEKALAPRRNRYTVSLAKHPQDIEECLRLRYEVFAGEMNAQLGDSGLDKDRFDDHCQHLMVREQNSGHIVATTRLLTSDDRDGIGFFYSETEFDIESILALPGRFMEIGRTCIHPEYRNGATLGILWQGLAAVTREQEIDYLIGCASIPFSHGDDYMASVMKQLRTRAFSPDNLRAIPRIPVRGMEEAEIHDKVALPPLLKGYLRVGARICGEPFWDAAFNVADVFVLVATEQLNARYSRHFMNHS
ncbi:MAG: GNAT family N-acetyltransferase [Gammaproteobacteria bacterium]|nr:GNAT family N-acetyltransferase [Gammaproteobacteria bacterium]